jgi:small-conductance mechanosensitive channel
MVDVERSKPESGLTLLWLSMVGIAVVALFVCAAALLATAEFLYRHLIAAPIAWLLTRLAASTWHG